MFEFKTRSTQSFCLAKPSRRPCCAVLLSTAATLLFFLRVLNAPRLLGDFRGIPRQPCHSDCLSWGRDPRESCFPSSLLGLRVLMETRIPGGPHIKTRGMAALGFQTNITHFLCCLRDRRGARRFISRGSPLPPHAPSLSPSTVPLPHPTGAAKSKRQSRERCCIPRRGQLGGGH